MSRLGALWWRIRSGLWFLPTLLVASATLLAVALVDASDRLDWSLEEAMPMLFGVGVEGSRSLLAAIATSMLTVAGTVFSITLAVLSLAASQYSPRVLRSFMADRPTQAVLGVFVGVFAYCVVVLRTIRGGEQPFVPSLAVLAAIVLAFVAIGLLVFFIHHLATSIEASAILVRIARGTHQAVETLFPDDLGKEGGEAAEEDAVRAIGAWTAAPALEGGYIVSLDNAALLEFARRRGRVVRMELAIGDFAVAGQPLASLAGAQAVDANACAALNRCYAFDRQRSIEQDAAFGVQQMVDVGLKALSPGINDQSTAVLCIDRLSEVLVRVARRRVENPWRRDGGALRVVAIGPTFAGLVRLAFADLREAAAGKPTVLARLVRALERVGRATASPGRRAVLCEELERVAECSQRTLAAPHEREAMLALAATLRAELNQGL